MRLKPLFVAAALFSASLAAHADTDNFTIFGGGQTITFSLPSNPTPDFHVSGIFFEFFSVPTTVNGVVLLDDGLNFFNAKVGVSVSDDFGDLSLEGPQVYSGDESDPTFLVGTYYGFKVGTDEVQGLTITDTDLSATPEPSSFLLLGTGLMGALGAMRKRFA